MFNKFKALILNPSTHQTVREAYAKVENQPWMAPYVGVLSMVGAVFLVGTSGYRVVDCLRFQEREGQCQEVVDINVPVILGGLSTVFGGWGWFNTYNKKLHPVLEESEGEKVEYTPPAPPLPPVYSMRDRRVVEQEKVKGHINSHPPVNLTEEEMVVRLHGQGVSQREIADQTNLSRYMVRKYLKNNRLI